MIGLLLFLASASQAPELNPEKPVVLSAEDRRAVRHALGITDADVERAQRAMGYVSCLYGNKESSTIVGLPDSKEKRPSFLSERRASCVQERSVSEKAFVEIFSRDSSIGEGQRVSKAKQALEGFDYKFEENVLRPEVAVARRKALQECIDEKGAANCF